MSLAQHDKRIFSPEREIQHSLAENLDGRSSDEIRGEPATVYRSCASSAGRLLTSSGVQLRRKRLGQATGAVQGEGAMRLQHGCGLMWASRGR